MSHKWVPLFVKRNFRVIGISLVVATIALALLVWGLKSIIHKKAESFLTEKFSEKVHLQYSSLRFSVLGRSVKLRNLDFVLQKRGLNARIHSIKLKGVNIFKLVWSDTIYAKSLSIEHPDIFYTMTNSGLAADSSVQKRPSKKKVFLLEKVSVSNGSAQICDSTGKVSFAINNLHFTVSDFAFKPNSLPGDKKLAYKIEKTLAERIVFCPSQGKTIITVNGLSVDTSAIHTGQITVDPGFDEKDYPKNTMVKSDLVKFSVDSIRLNKYFFDVETLSLAAIGWEKLTLWKPDVLIYSNRITKKFNTRKPLFSELLRNIKQKIEIDTVKIVEGKLSFKPHFDLSEAPAELFMENINGAINNIRNKDLQKEETHIVASLAFMGSGDFNADWRFHILNPADVFTIKGSINGLKVDDMNHFVEHTANLKLEGTVKTSYFFFSGNDSGAEGQLEMNYKDLKISLLKKNNPNEHKVKTFVANLLIRDKNSTISSGQTRINVQRDQKRGFFNLFWLCFQEGLKQNMLKSNPQNKANKK